MATYSGVMALTAGSSRAAAAARDLIAIFAVHVGMPVVKGVKMKSEGRSSLLPRCLSHSNFHSQILPPPASTTPSARAPRRWNVTSTQIKSRSAGAQSLAFQTRELRACHPSSRPSRKRTPIYKKRKGGWRGASEQGRSSSAPRLIRFVFPALPRDIDEWKCKGWV